MSLSSTQSTMFIKLVGIGLVFNPRKPADLYQAQWKNLREKSLKVLEKTRTISTNHRLSFPGWTRTLSMKQSNPSITKVFILSITFLFLAQFLDMTYFLHLWSIFLQSMPDQLDVPLWSDPLQRSHMSSNRSSLQREDWLRVVSSSNTSPPLNPSSIHPSSIGKQVVSSSITSSPLNPTNDKNTWDDVWRHRRCCNILTSSCNPINRTGLFERI